MDFYNILNWGLLIVTFAVMIGIGVWSGKTVSDSDEGGFLLAGRTLGPFVGAGTIVATGFSGWGFMGSPGVAYEFGAIEVLGNFFFAPAMLVAVLYFASFLQKRAATMGSNTIPEYIGQIHGGGAGGRLLQGVSAVITIVLLMVFMVSQIKAVGLLGASWLDIDMTTSAWMMISVIIIYTMWGGLAAVAWTDTVMVCGMAIGAIVIVVQMFTSVDLGEWVAKLNTINTELLNPTSGAPYGSPKGSVFYVFPYAFLFAAVLPYMAVRFLAFRPNVKMHTVGIYVAILGGLLSLIPLVGLYMRAFGPELAQADAAMPTYLQTFLHPALEGLITLFIIFAMQSTANSMLQTVSAATSHDLRLALNKNAEHDSPHALTINRVAVVALGLLGLLMMMYAPPFMLSWLGILGSGTLLASMIGPVFISTFWTGTTAGALVAMLAGFFTSGGLMLFSDFGWTEAPLIGCIVSSACYFGVSIATGRTSQAKTGRA